jgi:hypothetical protein
MCVAVQKNAYVSKAAQLFIRMVSEKFGSALLELGENAIKAQPQ